jgi:hypothetical protein
VLVGIVVDAVGEEVAAEQALAGVTVEPDAIASPERYVSRAVNREKSSRSITVSKPRLRSVHSVPTALRTKAGKDRSSMTRMWSRGRRPRTSQLSRLRLKIRNHGGSSAATTLAFTSAEWARIALPISLSSMKRSFLGLHGDRGLRAAINHTQTDRTAQSGTPIQKSTSCMRRTRMGSRNSHSSSGLVDPRYGRSSLMYFDGEPRINAAANHHERRTAGVGLALSPGLPSAAA